MFFRLHITTVNHRVFELLNLNLLFPNMQAIDFKVFNFVQCTDCVYQGLSLINEEGDHWKTSNERLIHTCPRVAQALLGKFVKLTALHLTFYDYKVDLLEFIIIDNPQYGEPL